jgi:hypothetical protein
LRAPWQTLSASTSLVIVFNKANPKKLSKSLANGTTDEAFTREFLKIHDSDDMMRSLFLEVKCLRIPELDEDNGDENNARLFQRQMTALRVMLVSMLVARRQHRREWGTGFRPNVWLPVFLETVPRTVVANEDGAFVRTVYMSEVLLQGILASDSPVTMKQAHQLFRFLLNHATGTHPMEAFETLLRVALRQLALAHILRAKLQMEGVHGGGLNRSEENFVLEQLLKEAEQLVELIMRLSAPCGSCATGEHVIGLTKVDRIWCLVPRGDHSTGGKHANCLHASNRMSLSEFGVTSFLRGLVQGKRRHPA